MLRFDDRVAVITGAGRGLGRSHALLLASRGCRVVINDLGVGMGGGVTDGNPAADVVAEIEQASGIAVADRHSVVDEADAVVAAAIERFGRIDILINSAGTLDSLPLGESDAVGWDRLTDVHFRGTANMCRAAWPHLVRAGAGRIVNTSSSAVYGEYGLTAYGAAKAGVFGFTRSLALEGIDAGVNVNAIMPVAWTRMTKRMKNPRIVELFRSRLTPDRISPLVAWLSHSETAVAGEIFRVGGGYAARVVTATTAGIEATDATPEAWAEQQARLMADVPLVEQRSCFESFMRELCEVDPTLDPNSLSMAGGVV